MNLSLPRITIAALRGGSGKTIVSLGLVSQAKEMGLRVATFKKGPDFIDAGWLSFASEAPCHNLDPFLMTKEQILYSFLSNSKNADFSLIEGNRGLFDGVDLEGTCSTAELSKILGSHLILIVDATMVTRTTAALVKGCQSFDPDLNLAGIIINRVATKRQEELIRKTIEYYCGIPVVGSIPRLKENPFPERHMGLVPYHESEVARQAIQWATGLVKDNLDMALIRKIAQNAGPISYPTGDDQSITDWNESQQGSIRIGVIRDGVFWFYYPENIKSFERLGATIVEINSLEDKLLPDIDALYIGGGFPETQASALAGNEGFRRDLKQKIDQGLPVYAECGGFMFLGQNLLIDHEKYPMVGAVPVDFALEKKPQGHGYTLLESIRENPYYSTGEKVKGHEFHYSRAIVRKKEGLAFVFRVLRGHGIDGDQDGLNIKNLLATYTHVHAGGDPSWPRRLLKVAKAIRFRRKISQGR